MSRFSIGDLVTYDHPAASFRKERGFGVVTKIIKVKYEPTKIEVCFPNFKKPLRKKCLVLFERELRLISENRRSSKGKEDTSS